MGDVISDRDEAQMIASILGGDMQLYHQLIRPYERSVFIMALTYLKNESDAEDVAQDTFLKALRHLASFRGEARFSTWLLSIALNEARSRLRRNRAVRTESIDQCFDKDDLVSPIVIRDWREIPSEMLERKEVRKMLQAAIANLPDIYRQVFLLRDVEELSIAETAEALTISIANAKVRLHRARILLQKELTPQLRHVNPKTRWLSWL